MLYLYGKTATAEDFKTHGIPIHGSYDEHVIRESGFYLKFKVLLDKDEKYKDIREEMIIGADTPDGYNQFRVHDIVKTRTYVEVTAVQLHYDLNKRRVHSFSLVNAFGSNVISTFVSNLKSPMHPFTISSGLRTTHNFSTDDDIERPAEGHNALEILNRICTRWGAELMLNGYDIRMVQRLGKASNALLYEHKNISEFTDESTVSELTTRIHVTSKFRPEQAEDDTEQPEDVVIKTTVDSPLINHYAQIYEADYTNNDLRTEAELIAWAKLKYSTENVDKPTRSIKVDTNIIDGTAIEYGDEVVLKYLIHDVDELIRCVGYDYNPISQTYYSITLGSVTKSLGSVIVDHTNSNLDNMYSDLLDRTVQIVQYTANETNRMTTGTLPVPNPIEGDLWFYHPEGYPQQITIRRYVNGEWIDIVDGLTGDRIKKQIEDLQLEGVDLAEGIIANEQLANAAAARAEESLEQIGTIDTKISDLRTDLNTVGGKAESSLEIIGIDGGAMYSKNRRLGSKSQPIQPDDRGLIQHNGEGFELGATYTISMIATCIFDDVITWEERSRTESVPFVRETQYRTDLLPEESFVQRNGINGTATYTWQIELVNGELTGNKTEEVRTNYKAPVNEIFIQGTKIMSDVSFNFDIIPFVPPADPTSNVTFRFGGGSVPPEEEIPTGEWYATPSVNVSSINRAPSTWKTMSLVDDFGAVGDGITDDSQALKAALQHSNTEPIRLDVGGSEYEYYIPSNGNTRIENYPGVSKGIVIYGNGAVFAPKNERTVDMQEFYLMQIRAEKNALVETYGFTLDGKHNPQDMFWWISQGKATGAAALPLQKGISYEGSDNVYIHDMVYQNMYGGYIIKLKNYTNVDIQNIRGYSVGGNDNPDSFGTIVHIDGQPDDSFINIDNMVIHGKKSPTNPAWVSWIGIVIENGTTQSSDPNVRLADRNTHINVTNSEFYDFESLYHIETQAGNIYWNTDNVKARVMNYTIGAGVRGEVKDRSNHMQLDILPFMRKGLSSGLYHTYRERPSNNLTDENGAFNYFHMYNSIINYLPKEDYVGGVDVHAVSHADSVVANLHNVTLNNVPRWLVANASANLYDTQVNLKQGYNSSYSIFSNPEQFLNIHGTTKYNQAGSWKEAAEGSYPPLVTNTGFVAPPLTGMIGDILPPA